MTTRRNRKGTRTYLVTVKGIEGLMTVGAGLHFASIWLTVPGVTFLQLTYSEAITLLRKPGAFLYSEFKGGKVKHYSRSRALASSTTRKRRALIQDLDARLVNYG